LDDEGIITSEGRFGNRDMARTLKELTRIGTDARKIAALLQAKAPPGRRLAYINEREAALLKDAGGKWSH
jgi:hypothetical protein